MPKRDKSFSKHKSFGAEKMNVRSELYNVGKEDKSLKPIYSTPS
jgi:hypothetical protein